MKKISWFDVVMTICFVFTLLQCGCAPKMYKVAMQEALLHEEQSRYEKAYEYYQQALEVTPNDEEAKVKLDQMAKLISIEEMNKGIADYQNQKYILAVEYFEKSLEYNKENEESKSYLDDIKREIHEKNIAAEARKAENDWIAAIGELTSISEQYSKDPQYSEKAADWTERGFNYYFKTGIDLRSTGDYIKSRDMLKHAQQLKDLAEVSAELETAENYIEADKLYNLALKNVSQDITESMEMLYDARALASDHFEINHLIIKLLPEWADIFFQIGKDYLDNKQLEKAYGTFNTIFTRYPEYPGIEEYHEKTKVAYLNSIYPHFLELSVQNNFSQALSVGEKIRSIDPEYIDATEVMTRIYMKAHNAFYQRGLKYMNTGNYGKAILSFRSAEKQLTETMITQNKIDEAWNKIKEISQLKIGFWEFFERIGDVSLSKYTTARFKEILAEETAENPLKNIEFKFDTLSKNDMSYRSDRSKTIDWKVIQAEDCDTVIVGDIKQFKVDKSVNAEWKIRKRMVKRVIDNKEHTQLVMRKAELNRALALDEIDLKTDNEDYLELLEDLSELQNKMESIDGQENEDDSQENKDDSQEKKEKIQKKILKIEKEISEIEPHRLMKKGDVKDELEEIEDKLPGISPKLEALMEEEESYQVEKHTMAGHVQIEISILSQDGSEFWPTKEYTDIYSIVDLVVPPNMNAESPEERKGDPLTLPPDSQFKEEAIDYVFQEIIVPDVMNTLRDYGLRYYENTPNLLESGDLPVSYGSEAYNRAIEEYFKFLVCYEDQGLEDTLPEQITQYLDDRVSDLWLFGKVK